MAKGKGEASDTFERKTFSVSRLAEFASIAELTKQTGQPPENWLLVVLKELVDNALDEAEKAGVAPVIEIVVEGGFHHRRRPWPGHRARHHQGADRLHIKTSSNAAYVSPTRGQQGNALQSILPMGFVLDGKAGEVRDREPRQGAHHPLHRRPGAADAGCQPRRSRRQR